MYQIFHPLFISDVDECINVQSPSCPMLSTCVNSIGSFQCLCQGGYTLTSQSETGLLFCLDIDECLDEGLVDCHSNAGCFNQLGGYTCLCLESQGYSGNGTFCAGNYPRRHMGAFWGICCVKSLSEYFVCNSVCSLNENSEKKFKISVSTKYKFLTLCYLVVHTFHSRSI